MQTVCDPAVEGLELLETETETLRAAALDALRSSGYLVLRSLACEVQAGVVTVSGRVPRFHLKQVAQAVLLRLSLFRGVRNCIEVGAAC